MKRTALPMAMLAAALIGPAVTEATVAEVSYRKTTSQFEGKAVCAFDLRVQDAAGETVTFTLRPAPENASGENGGEIRMLEPARASTGNEVACEAYPDTTAVGTTTVPDDDHTFRVILQLHSHPDDNCSAAGLARGNVRIHVPNPGAMVAGTQQCDTREDRGNVRPRRKKRPKPARTGRIEEFVWEVVNDGPGATTGTTAQVTMPQNMVFIESATADGSPCTVTQEPGPPAMNVIDCSLGNVFPDEAIPVQVNVVPRRTGSFESTIRTDAANNGPIHSGTDQFSTNTQQGTNRTLSVRAKARGNAPGSGSVNISPDGGAPSCAVDGTTRDQQCFNFYADGTTVTLTAKPSAGTSVVWEGACAGTTGNGPCTITMNTDKSATVRFNKD